MADPRVILDGERYVLDILGWKFKDGAPLIFDIGANVGDYAREVIQRVPNATLFCFEPQPDARAELRKWVERHSRGALVTIVPMAMSDRHGPMVLRATKNDNCYLAGLYRTYDKPSSLPLDRPIEAEATTLDEYCRLFGIERIHLLKIDVEGHELKVLDGARRMLVERRVDLIQFEMADVAREADWTFADAWYKLDMYGYTLWLEHADHLEPLSPDAPLDDLPFYVNVLAVGDHCKWWGA